MGYPYLSHCPCSVSKQGSDTPLGIKQTRKAQVRRKKKNEQRIRRVRSGRRRDKDEGVHEVELGLEQED